jgi:hypothetical protein
MVERVNLALGRAVQEGWVAAGVVLDHAHMQVGDRLCLRRSIAL